MSELTFEWFWIIVGNIGRRMVEVSDKRLHPYCNPVAVFSKLLNDKEK